MILQHSHIRRLALPPVQQELRGHVSGRALVHLTDVRLRAVHLDAQAKVSYLGRHPPPSVHVTLQQHILSLIGERG